MIKSNTLVGDVWGGFAAMLVALPAAIAFGVTIYAAIGGTYAAYGAMAGILGVAAVGLIASVWGGTDRLISAPSAPAAAVLSAFVIESMMGGSTQDTVLGLLLVVALMAGVFQILFGVIGLGQMIKYMPYPVVSGYLSGVGLYIIGSQMPKLLGVPDGLHFLESMQDVSLWEWQSITVGAATVITMLLADRIFRIIPAVIMALGVGTGAYFLLGLADHSLLVENSRFIIGELGGGGNSDFIGMLINRFQQIRLLSPDTLTTLLFPALTLAALLSIDTLKTSIIVDSVTHSYHNPNRELIAQGIGNVTSSLIGGIPGSGTMGPTMVNISSGGTSRRSGIVAGIAAIIAFVLFERYIEWIPVAALAGILIVIGFRMIDKNSVRLLRSRETALDFLIIVAVTLSAISISLIAAAGVGLVLAVILYIAQQIRISVVYRHVDGSEAKSKIVRSGEEAGILREEGDEFSLYELHGSLFFGTANQLYSILQHDLQEKKYIILDMKRVQTVDLSAAHILLQIKDILHDKNGYLLLSRLPHKLPTGDDMESYFNHVGLLKHLSPMMVFNDLDDAVEWVEERIIDEYLTRPKNEKVLELSDFDFFRGRNRDTMEDLQSLVDSRSYQKGDVVFLKGDLCGEIFLIRSGQVRIVLPVGERTTVHLETLSPNSFFGEFSFLGGDPQYTDAIAAMPTELYVISRSDFDRFAEHHHKAAFQFMQSLASELAERLRTTSSELGNEYDV